MSRAPNDRSERAVGGGGGGSGARRPGRGGGSEEQEAIDEETTEKDDFGRGEEAAAAAITTATANTTTEKDRQRQHRQQREQREQPSRPRHRPRTFSTTLSSLFHWLQVKKYQYEVTFSLYMLTPTEKFIFSKSYTFPSVPLSKNTYHVLILFSFFGSDFILFVLVAMMVAAASMYLPNHISTIYRRIWYYMHGEIVGITKGGTAAPVAQAGGGGGEGVDMFEQ